MGTIELLLKNEATEFVERCNVLLRETPTFGIEKKSISKEKYFTTAISAFVAVLTNDDELTQKRGMEEMYWKHQTVKTLGK